MGFPLEMFPVLFAIPRTAGWLAHWQEMLDQDSKIARPRQLYIGAERRDYVPIDRALSGRAGRTRAAPGRQPGDLAHQPLLHQGDDQPALPVNRKPRASPRAP